MESKQTVFFFFPSVFPVDAVKVNLKGVIEIWAGISDQTSMNFYLGVLQRRLVEHAK